MCHTLSVSWTCVLKQVKAMETPNGWNFKIYPSVPLTSECIVRSWCACAKRLNSSIMALVHGESQDRWYFTKEELKKTPSVLRGIDIAKELSYRQQSANLIQDMGQRLTVYPWFKMATFLVIQHRSPVKEISRHSALLWNISGHCIHFPYCLSIFLSFHNC